MKILLFSRSRVVREMVRLAAQKAGVGLECVEEPGEIEGDRYELLLVDENIFVNPLELSEHIIIAKSAAIREKGEKAKGYDHILNKPFLPSDILHLLEREKTEEGVRLPLHGFVAKKREEPQVLDGEEIARIKEILQEETSGDVPGMEEEIASRMFPVPGSGREENISLEVEELFNLLSRCKTKKLQKALEGVELTITLRFPSKEES